MTVGGQNLPDDLVPLPSAPWDERPTELPLDVEECRTALWRSAGNVTDAAALLKVKPARLRSFIGKSEYLSRELEEAKEQLLDISETNVRDALTDAHDPGRRDSMTRYVLTSLGGKRGWGSNPKGNKTNINLPGGKGSFTISWDDGTEVVGDESQMIDVTPNEAAE